MTRKTTRKRPAGPRLPGLRVHKQSGRCYATIGGRPHWFGHKDDPTTRERYDAFLAQWLARGRRLEEPKHDESLTVRQLVARYLRHLDEKHDETWHRNNDNRLTQALKPLLALYGAEPASEFSPKKLQAVRHGMLTGGKLCRGEINCRIQTLRRCFRWAVAQEFVPAALIQGLQAVDALDVGEYGVREGKHREPVAESVVFATLPFLHPVAAAAVELLWWTGARPSEVLNLCPRDIDRSDPACWVAKLSQHKNSRKGKTRELKFGPNAQRVLRRFLDRVPRPAADKPLLAPRRAMAERRAERRAARETPLYPSHERRYERERRQRKAEGRERKFGDRYDSNALRIAVTRAVKRANRGRDKKDKLPQWTPYALRHSALTRIRDQRGLEAARAIGGHASAVMTESYSRQAERELARRTMAELG